MKAPFQIEWLLVTPALAKSWLEKNTHNRNLRESTVNNYARDMLNGAWSPNHQGVAFGEDGVLMDGQHRLAAIVRSGVAVPMLVCTEVPRRIEGVKSNVMDTVDRGSARSIPDILKLEHGLKADAGMISAACVTIARLAVPVPNRARRATLAQTLEVLTLYRDGLRYVSENRPHVNGLRSAIVCGAVAFAYAIRPKAVEEFYRRFGSGAGLKEGDAILTLRNQATSGGFSDTGSAAERRELAELVLHALWCHVHRKTMLRVPRPTERPGADWFRDAQPEKVGTLQALFPEIGPKAAAPVKAVRLTPAAERLLAAKGGGTPLAGKPKLTPLAESLVKGKDMSERLKRKLGAAA